MIKISKGKIVFKVGFWYW